MLKPKRKMLRPSFVMVGGLCLLSACPSCGTSSAHRMMIEGEGISGTGGAAGESPLPSSGAAGELFLPAGGSSGVSGSSTGGTAGGVTSSGGGPPLGGSGGDAGASGAALSSGAGGEPAGGSGGATQTDAGAAGSAGEGGTVEPCVGRRTLVDEDFAFFDPELWRLAGSAVYDGFVVALTPMDTGQKGQLWSSLPIVGGEFALRARFRVLDNTQPADGFAFILADTDGPPEFLSQTIQQTLVNTGLPGYAVFIDTYMNPGDPTTPYLAVVDLPSGARIRTALMSSAIPNLANGVWRTLEVHLDDSVLSVNVDGGVSLLDVPVSPASSYYWGFMATCGAFPTIYAVDDVLVDQACP